MILTASTFVFLFIGLALGALIVLAFLYPRVQLLRGQLAAQTEQKNAFAETFKALSADALQANNQQFLTLANENLQRFQQQADQNLQQKQDAIANLLKPVTDTLQKMDTKIADIEQKREGAYVELKTLVNAMKDQHQYLGNQTASLVQTLRAPTSRGQWGEMQLKRVLDFSGLLEGVHYERQVNVTGMRPDIMVHLPPQKVLLIDAKVPMQSYLSAMQADVTDDQKNILLTKHAADMKGHIKALSDKSYASGFDSFDWVVMFVPLDGLVQMAMDKQPDLIEYAWKMNVVVATPTNLLALMRTVSYAHDQFKVNENAKEIAKLGETIYKRMTLFAEHMDKMGRGISSALNSYNQAVGSLERNVLSSLRKMKDIGVATHETKEPPVLEMIDLVPRVLTAPDLLEKTGTET